MPPERFDWSDRRPPQASPSPAGLAPAGLAEAAPPQGGAAAPSAPPDLVVRTRRSDHQLTAGTTYHIGRDPKSDIVMTDSRVSWRHAVLRVDGEGWVIEDLASTNGTFLGLQRLDRIEISADCVIRLGNPDDGPVLRCMPQVPAAAAPPAAAPPADHPGTALSVPPAPPAPVPPAPEPAPGRDSESWWQPPPEAEPAPPPVAPYEPAAPPPCRASPPRRRGRAPREHAAPSGPAAQRQPVQRAQPAQPVSPDLLPSVDRRPTARMPLPAKAMRIGRTPENDLVLSDLNVSRQHAELRKSPTGSYEIVDLGSHNGTFVNGQRVSSQVLTEQDLVSIGSSTFRLKDGELRQFVDDGNITFTAQDLVVTVGGGKVLLDHVTFPIPEKCLLGVIGPSGAGKSTLLGALTGMRPATTGNVLYDNRDLYQNYNELRYRIGLVPQESVLHTQLTARRALQYSAELRFPADTKPPERDGRVDEVMGELGLTRHANTRADRLSGGQLKRVNVAQELLTKPSLLFLDEPTSGLDPGLDKSVMEQMRDLAHDGRTVIVVTHSVDNLDTCDRLLVLVPGGRIAYYGPPEEGLAYFGQARWAEVFQAFERVPGPRLGGRVRRFARLRPVRPGPGPRPSQVPNSQELAATPPPQRRGAFRQMTTLTRRYVRVIAADRGYLTFMALLPILLGALISQVPDQRRPGGHARNQPGRGDPAADHGHLRVPGRDGQLGAGTGQGTLHLDTRTGGRPVVRRVPGLQAAGPGRHQHPAVGSAGADRRVLAADARPWRLPHRRPAGRADPGHRPARRRLDVPRPVRVRHRQHVGEGDALPGAVHHGPGRPLRLRGTAGPQPGAQAARDDSAVPLGSRRRGEHREPQRDHPAGWAGSSTRCGPRHRSTGSATWA